MESLLQIVLKARSYTGLANGYAWATLFTGRSLKVGAGLRLEGFPDVQITDGARIEIGTNVEIRRHVEIRAHRGAVVRIADGVRIDRAVRILATNGSILTLGRGCRIGIGSVLNGGDAITVGDSALLSGYVYIQTSMHRHVAGSEIKEQGYEHEPIIVGHDAWLGAHVVVMPGRRVEDGAIVGANAVVTQHVPRGSIAVGVPARIIGHR